MTVNVGFTGSRKGMTLAQIDAVRRMLSGIVNVRFHHGDCVGSDHQAHALARELGREIVTHPPIKDTLRAFCLADVEMEPKDYLARDRDIVDDTSVMIAAPDSKEVKPRSGTWYTIRYAQKQGRPVCVVYPDGTYYAEGI